MPIAMRGILFATIFFALTLPAGAQIYPNKLIRVIAPFPPGGGATEIIIRLVAPKMQEYLGQSVIIDNRAGANGAIGSEMVARAAPDGYTLLYATSSTLATSAYLAKNLPFDPVKDFAAINLMASPITTFVAHPSVPVGNIKELIEYAKKNPGKLTYASSGIGSMQHLTGEAFKRTTGIDMLHVPYKGAAPATNAVIAGQVDIYFPGASAVKPLMPTGKLKVLGLLELKRYAGMPDIPTVSETVPGFTKGASWFAMFGPAAMPQAIIARLNAEINKALKQPDLLARFDESGTAAIGGTPEELANLLKSDIEKTGTLIKALGIVPE
ncbi:MAG: tripartite tricarboxylate transporter substrate binding protein [Betaproteobacteria bacterium]|nr:tripartite tricarboxylate transporter substrate binding protein [Betaproteobacteria bacterium]